ncbi:MAG: hypothetical protein QM817_36560 [Archangium sp.]
MMRALSIAVVVVLGAACAPVSEPFVRQTIERDAGADSRCAPSGSRQRGDHCTCTSDCMGDAVCLTEETSGFPQGLCATSCINGVPCGAGFVCSNSAVCVSSCETDADCRGGAFCVAGRCNPFCDSDDDCLSGNCNRYIGNCLVAGETPQGLGLDAACTVGSQCRSNLCLENHCTTPCSVEKQNCPDEGVCIKLAGDVGRCHARCVPGSTCPTADRRCVSLFAGLPTACIPTSTTGCLGPAPSPNGGENCGCDNDCDQGSRCLPERTSGLPNGLCVTPCTTDAECPSTHMCFGSGCMKRCLVDDACPVGRLCGFGACLPWCVTNAECASGSCDTYRGRCNAPLSAPGELGATCTSGAGCKSELCDTSKPGGSCYSYCSIERGVCPDNGVCLRGTPTGDSGICARRCMTPADCPQPGAACVSGHCQ